MRGAPTGCRGGAWSCPLPSLVTSLVSAPLGWPILSARPPPLAGEPSPPLGLPPVAVNFERRLISCTTAPSDRAADLPWSPVRTRDLALSPSFVTSPSRAPSGDEVMAYGLLAIGAVDTCQHAQQTASTALGHCDTGGGMRTRATHCPLETEAPRASAGVAPLARQFAPRRRASVPAPPRRVVLRER